MGDVKAGEAETTRAPWTAVASRPSTARTLYDLLRGVATWRPDAPAILAPGRRPLTHAGLLKQVDGAVSALRSLGIGPSDRVAVLLPAGPEMTVATLAVACCAVSVPLGDASTAAELEAYLRLLRVTAALVTPGSDAVQAATEALGLRRITVIPEADGEAGVFRLGEPLPPTPRDTREPDAGGTAILVCTSATTARPKVVPLTHTMVVQGSLSLANAFDLGCDDRYLSVMPTRHGFGLVPVVAGLMAGGSAIITPGFDPGHFWDWLEECRPTWYGAPPHLLGLIADRAPEVTPPAARRQLGAQVRHPGRGLLWLD